MLPQKYNVKVSDINKCINTSKKISVGLADLRTSSKDNSTIRIATNLYGSYQMGLCEHCQFLTPNVNISQISSGCILYY